MKEWLENHIAELTISMGLLAVILFAIVAVSVSDAATADHPEGDYGGVGVSNVRVTEPAADGSYNVIVQRVQAVNPRRVDQAGQFVYPEWSYGKTGCSKAIEQINHKDVLGLSTEFYTFHKIRWCWDGKVVMLAGNDRRCVANDGGLDWYVLDKSTSAGYVNWGGRAHGSWRDKVQCTFKTAWFNTVHFQSPSEIVGRADGSWRFP